MVSYIARTLEMDNHTAVPMITPTWRENCKKSSMRVRCDTEDLAKHVLLRLQYANTFFNERIHLVTPVVAVADDAGDAGAGSSLRW